MLMPWEKKIGNQMIPYFYKPKTGMFYSHWSCEFDPKKKNYNVFDWDISKIWSRIVEHKS